MRRVVFEEELSFENETALELRGFRSGNARFHFVGVPGCLALVELRDGTVITWEDWAGEEHIHQCKAALQHARKNGIVENYGAQGLYKWDGHKWVPGGGTPVSWTRFIPEPTQ